jgi:hypothetical protein
MRYAAVIITSLDHDVLVIFPFNNQEDYNRQLYNITTKYSNIALLGTADQLIVGRVVAKSA